MKRFVYLMLVISFNSCNVQLSRTSESEEIGNKKSYHHIRVDNFDRFLSYKLVSSRQCGFFDENGKVLIEAQFQNCTNFFGNYANVLKDSTFGYINRQGEIRLFPEYDQVYWYTDSVGYAMKNKKLGLIHRNGELRSEIEYDRIEFSTDGYFTVKKEDKWIVIDREGAIVINDSITLEGSIVYEGNTIYQERVDDKIKKGVINVSGDIIIPAKYDEISVTYLNGLVRVEDNGKKGVVNKDGIEVIPVEYDNIGYDFIEDLVSAKKGGKWGYINEKNEVVIDFMYDSARSFSEGLAMVTKNGKAGYINRNNEIIIPLEMKPIWRGDFEEGLAVFKSENGKYGYIDPKGKVKIEPIYDSALSFEKGRAHVEQNDKVGVINKKGEYVIDLMDGKLWRIESGAIRYCQ